MEKPKSPSDSVAKQSLRDVSETIQPTAVVETHRRRLTRPRTFADNLTQFGVPLAGIALFVFAGWFVLSTRPINRNPLPPIEPARSPYAETLAASGVVEAQTENISVGSLTAGVVVEVFVQVGDEVQVGSPLFQLDDRALNGQRDVKRALVDTATSELVRLEAEPRKEKIPVAAADVDFARAAKARESDAFKRVQDLALRKVATEQDVVQAQESFLGAQASLAKAEASLDLLQAGTWKYDLDVSRAVIKQAEAEVAHIEIEIERLTVRSLVDGRVLQVNILPGEFVGAPPGQPLVILGNVEKLRVRVDIDEFDIARFQKSSKAFAMPRGSLQEKYPLEFVRIEPFVVPKKSLTGGSAERVDTRVLQVIYECDPNGRPAMFVGQQVEVFIDGDSESKSVKPLENAAASHPDGH